MTFAAMLAAVQDAGEDYEFYPTSDRMLAVVARHIPRDTKSLMDIGAGDGRVLLELAKRCEHPPLLYAIEKSNVLIQAQPENVIPVGTDLFEQNLACLPVDYLFSNPPYSQFELWASTIIETGHALKAFLVIPRRWKDSAEIADALKRRGATARIIHSDDFLTGADRTARAVIDIVEVSYPAKREYGGWRRDQIEDPFDKWFDHNVSTFDPEESNSAEEASEQKDLARIRELDSIHDLVEAYNEEYARMQENYQAIFRLDHALLKELGVKKDDVREGIKAKMAGLKSKYWTLLFERLDVVTDRLSTATKAKFLEKLTGRAAIAFTVSNAYAIVIWAIKNANKYFNEQTVQLFRDLSTFDGVANYKSNVRAWEKSDWRYRHVDEAELRPSRYALDYRIVVERHGGIYNQTDRFTPSHWDYPGNLNKRSHELLDDVRAVLNNLGFATMSRPTRNREWFSGEWQNWHRAGSDDAILFQAKAFKNGNVHFRFLPDAIKALNVEAGRLLGWLRSHEDVETELGYTPAEAKRFFFSTKLLVPSNVRLLGGESAT